MSGKPGHTGHTGATGRRGLQGTPYGAPGTTFYSPSGRITTSVGGSSGNSQVSLRTDAYGVTWLIGTATTTNVTFPSTISSNDYGAFWSFRNNQTTSKLLVFANGTVQINGNDTADRLTLGSGNSITLVFSGGSNTTSTYIAL
jgi:hypothetical protein